MISEQELRERRIKAVQALREADESRRCDGALYSDGTDDTPGAMCALGWMGHKVLGGSPDYPEIEKAFDLSEWRTDDITGAVDEVSMIYVMSDEHIDGDEDKPHRYTLREIGDMLERYWDL